MSKPKNKPNAFSVFCQEWRKKEEKKNRHFTLAEAISNPECNQAWKEKSEDEKARYKSIAKNTKFQVEGDKKTGLGESLSEIERVQRKKKEFIDNMKDYIASITRGAKEHNSIQKLTFYVIHTNFMFNRTLDNNVVEYYPAEICVARCSLDQGVEDVYHVLVSEPVLKGYRNDAMTHSKDTHQIPVDGGFEGGKRSYQEIFEELCNFMEPGKKNNVLPPLYTVWAKDDIYCPVKSILGRLAEANDKHEEYFRLYSFEELFASIYNAVLEQTGVMDFESITALREIKKDPYAYKSGLECEFHKAIEAGALYCSQSIVKRWFYVLCDFCCDPLNIIKVGGVHTPVEKKMPVLSMSKLSSSMSTMSFNESRYSSSLSMSNVSSDYRARASRSAQEEIRRKAESKPVTIIDHSKLVKKLPEVIERPLRVPYTKSTLINDDTVDSESIDYSEDSFPSIGRGAAIRKRTQENKGSAGHGSGYAGALKK